MSTRRVRPSDFISTLFLENVHPRAGRGAWHGGPTAVGALRGVTAEQAAWEPMPGRKSIWGLVLHIAYWKYAVRRRLEGGKAAQFPRRPSNWPRLPDLPDARAWADDQLLLRNQHELLVTVVRRMPLHRYGEALRGGKRWTIGELILGIAQHDAYHTGQIQMLKRLWQTSHR